MKRQCVAIVEGDRINLIIRKEDKGYKAFAKVLLKIKKHGCFSWYGDVEDVDGKEQCGLIITRST